jgi:hypothetical protein
MGYWDQVITKPFPRYVPDLDCVIDCFRDKVVHLCRVGHDGDGPSRWIRLKSVLEQGDEVFFMFCDWLSFWNRHCEPYLVVSFFIFKANSRLNFSSSYYLMIQNDFPIASLLDECASSSFLNNPRRQHDFLRIV